MNQNFPNYIKVLGGPNIDALIEVGNKRYNLGKSPDCDIALNDDSLENLHCTFFVDNGNITIIRCHGEIKVNHHLVSFQGHLEIPISNIITIGNTSFAVGNARVGYPDINQNMPLQVKTIKQSHILNQQNEDILAKNADKFSLSKNLKNIILWLIITLIVGFSGYILWHNLGFNSQAVAPIAKQTSPEPNETIEAKDPYAAIRAINDKKYENLLLLLEKYPQFSYLKKSHDETSVNLSGMVADKQSQNIISNFCNVEQIRCNIVYLGDLDAQLTDYLSKKYPSITPNLSLGKAGNIQLSLSGFVENDRAIATVIADILNRMPEINQSAINAGDVVFEIDIQNYIKQLFGADKNCENIKSEFTRGSLALSGYILGNYQDSLQDKLQKIAKKYADKIEIRNETEIIPAFNYKLVSQFTKNNQNYLKLSDGETGGFIATINDALPNGTIITKIDRAGVALDYRGKKTYFSF